MGLSTAVNLLDSHLEQAVHEEQTYIQFLDSLLASEQMERKRKNQEKRMKLSRLPHRKQLEDFDFSFQPGIDKRQISELATLAFAQRAENVILLGPPGVSGSWIVYESPGGRDGCILHDSGSSHGGFEKSTDSREVR